jgi:AcrR family transcriptional regulator
MAGAGLTHGAFYSYFASKSASIPRFRRASLQIPIGRVAGKASKWTWPPQTWDSKLLEPICLASISRMSRTLVRWWPCRPTSLATAKVRKRVFQTVFQAMVSVLERSSLGNRQPRRATAQATAALCVGGMVVARALVDRALADELRDACMTVALTLGGWYRHRNSKRANPKRSKLSAGSQFHRLFATPLHTLRTLVIPSARELPALSSLGHQSPSLISNHPSIFPNRGHKMYL